MCELLELTVSVKCDRRTRRGLDTFDRPSVIGTASRAQQFFKKNMVKERALALTPSWASLAP